jgi:hypothetical protein
MTDRSIRASDKERESVVDVLRDAYAEGRLTLTEFDERSSAAYDAKTRGDLGGLTHDLPVRPLFDGETPPRELPPPADHPAVSSSQRPHRPHRERPLGRLLPIVFVWIVIAAAAGSPDTAAALSVVFICLLACRVGYGGR